MMTLLGQNGQKQDFRKGMELIKFSADAADENAPQGAYVSAHMLSFHTRKLTNIVGIWDASGT